MLFDFWKTDLTFLYFHLLLLFPTFTLFLFFHTGAIQIDYSQQETTQLPTLVDFLHRITSHFVEITTYTKADSKLSTNIGEVPPLIPPCQRANEVLNTEASKKSVYLTKKEKLNDVEGNNLFSSMHYFPPMYLYYINPYYSYCTFYGLYLDTCYLMTKTKLELDMFCGTFTKTELIQICFVEQTVLLFDFIIYFICILPRQLF